MVSCVAWTWVNPPKARRSLDNIIYNSVYSEAPLPRFSCFKLLQEGKHSGCLIWITHVTFCSVNSSTHLKSLICHHVPSSSLLRFFKIMKHHKKASWFINRILFLYFQFTIFSLLSTILEVLNVQWGRPWRLYPFKGAVVNNPTRSPMALGKEATWFDSAWSSATWVNISSICNRLITIKKKRCTIWICWVPRLIPRIVSLILQRSPSSEEFPTWPSCASSCSGTQQKAGQAWALSSWSALLRLTGSLQY